MKETSPDARKIQRLRSWASSKVHGGDRGSTRRPGRTNDPDPSLLPITNHQTVSTVHSASTNSATLTPSASNSNNGPGDGAPDTHDALEGSPPDGHHAANGSSFHAYSGVPNSPSAVTHPEASAQAPGKGSQLGIPVPVETTNEKPSADGESNDEKNKDRPPVFKRFFTTSKTILFHSWINLLLVFVPVGIAVNFIPNMSPGVIFGMNAIAIIPLAGLLSHATETVAHRMGDAIGALMNITFGNAVELIILYVRAQLGLPPCLCYCKEGSLTVFSLSVCMSALLNVIKTRKTERSPTRAVSNQSRPVS